MLCSHPLGINGATVGCGHCGPCIANRRRLWTGRLLLEQTAHKGSLFATLTWREIPDGGDESYAYEFVSFIKRLRYFVGPVRYYGVREFGEQTLRPHWHCALFGVDISHGADVVRAWRGHDVSVVRKVPEGSVGGVHIGELNHDSAMYLCKYMCKDDGASALVRMSRNPGIGKLAIDGIAESLVNRGGAAALGSVGDVPSELRVDGKRYPVGRYLRRALREAVGWGPETPVEARRKVAYERSKESAQDIALRSRKRAATAINHEARMKRKRSGKL